MPWMSAYNVEMDVIPRTWYGLSSHVRSYLHREWWKSMDGISMSVIHDNLFFKHKFEFSESLIFDYQNTWFFKFTAKVGGFFTKFWLGTHSHKARWASRVAELGVSCDYEGLSLHPISQKIGFFKLNFVVKYRDIWNNNNTGPHNFFKVTDSCLKGVITSPIDCIGNPLFTLTATNWSWRGIYRC